MSLAKSTLARLEQDIVYLEKNLVPIKSSGEKINALDFEWHKDRGFPKLTDVSAEQIADALVRNDQFVGPLNLEENDLTDLSALAISRVLRKAETTNITKLNLSKNK